MSATVTEELELQKNLKTLRDKYLAEPWYKRFLMRLFQWKLSSFIANLTLNETAIGVTASLIALTKKAWFKHSNFSKNIMRAISDFIESVRNSDAYREQELGSLHKLPQEVLAHVASYLPNEAVPKNNNHPIHGAFALFIFRPQEAARTYVLTKTLLKHVISGSQVTASNMICNYPHLLMSGADITDLSGRRFGVEKQVTALQLALWASDTRMVRVIWASLQSSPAVDDTEKQKIKEDLETQWKNLEESGLSYTLCARDDNTGELTQDDIKDRANNPLVIKESIYDWSELLVLYQNYLKNYESLSTEEHKQIQMAIGCAQFMLPLSVLRKFCHLHHELMDKVGGISCEEDWFRIENKYYNQQEMLDIRGLPAEVVNLLSKSVIEILRRRDIDYDEPRREWWSPSCSFGAPSLITRSQKWFSPQLGRTCLMTKISSSSVFRFGPSIEESHYLGEKYGIVPQTSITQAAAKDDVRRLELINKTQKKLMNELREEFYLSDRTETTATAVP